MQLVPPIIGMLMQADPNAFYSWEPQLLPLLLSRLRVATMFGVTQSLLLLLAQVDAVQRQRREHSRRRCRRPSIPCSFHSAAVLSDAAAA